MISRRAARSPWTRCEKGCGSGLQLTFAESALVDLEEILTYSWANFPNTAEQFGVALLDHVELLKRFPLMGTMVLNRPGVRRLVHTPILIYYSVDQ
jgi:plasmid stabilization system protein ParE